MLKKHGAELSTLTAISSFNVEHPIDVYRFLKDIGSTYHQYIPIVERADNALVTPWSVTPAQLERCFIETFDEWVRNDVARIRVQIFEHALSAWVGIGSTACTFSETCGVALVVEHDGSVYSCDHYVQPDHRLGNVLTRHLCDMAESEFQQRFGQDKCELLPACCRTCDVAFICNGDCPRHRFVTSPDGKQVSYLCEAYKGLFHHMVGHLEIMGELLRRRASPALIMDMLRCEDEEVLVPEVDAPCSCGSGRKLKNCHGRHLTVA